MKDRSKDKLMTKYVDFLLTVQNIGVQQLEFYQTSIAVTLL